MTHLAACPTCGETDRVDIIDPPAWNPDARYTCGRCNNNYDASERNRLRALQAWSKRNADWSQHNANRAANVANVRTQLHEIGT